MILVQQNVVCKLLLLVGLVDYETPTVTNSSSFFHECQRIALISNCTYSEHDDVYLMNQDLLNFLNEPGLNKVQQWDTYQTEIRCRWCNNYRSSYDIQQ